MKYNLAFLFWILTVLAALSGNLILALVFAAIAIWGNVSVTTRR